MGKCLYRGGQTGTHSMEQSNRRLVGAVRGNGATRAYRVQRQNQARRSILLFMQIIREPVVFCIRKRLLCPHVREWLGLICIEIVCDSLLPSLCIPQEKKKDIFLSLENMRGTGKPMLW